MTLVDAISAVIVAEVSLFVTDATETGEDDVDLFERSMELSTESAPALRVICGDSVLVTV